MKAKVIQVNGHWSDGARITRRNCLILPRDMPDSVCDEVMSQVQDEDIVYVFSDTDDVPGNHAHITIDSYEPVYEINLGALQ